MITEKIESAAKIIEPSFALNAEQKEYYQKITKYFNKEEGELDIKKDPAFLFYTNDFDRGCQFFTDEQVGKYIRLLMAQHQHGHLSEK